MFKKILFATTASPTCDDAAKVAFDLAKKYNATLFAFHVFGIPTHGASPFVVDFRTGKEESADEDYTAWVKEEMKNKISYNVGPLPDGADTLQIWLAGSGWYTGHYKYVDDFHVYQE